LLSKDAHGLTCIGELTGNPSTQLHGARMGHVAECSHNRTHERNAPQQQDEASQAARDWTLKEGEQVGPDPSN
ncbi:MAG: hypothetical protein K0Q80_2452, partial [Microvirga sp.]|nr:hypothetical protein [Microvirga sp.]